MLNWKKKGERPETNLQWPRAEPHALIFLPGDTSVVFASTHLIDSLCPEVPPKGPNGEYVWPIYDAYDIFYIQLGRGK